MTWHDWRHRLHVRRAPASGAVGTTPTSAEGSVMPPASPTESAVPGTRRTPGLLPGMPCLRAWPAIHALAQSASTIPHGVSEPVLEEIIAETGTRTQQSDPGVVALALLCLCGANADGETHRLCATYAYRAAAALWEQNNPATVSIRAPRDDVLRDQKHTIDTAATGGRWPTNPNSIGGRHDAATTPRTSKTAQQSRKRRDDADGRWHGDA